MVNPTNFIFLPKNKGENEKKGRIKFSSFFVDAGQNPILDYLIWEIFKFKTANLDFNSSPPCEILQRD